jgi:HK97 family phage portal protein
MRIPFTSLEITRRKAVQSLQTPRTGSLQSVDGSRSWWPIIRESFAGAWQQNVEVTVSNVTTHPTLFSCVTLIASTVSKMRLRLVQETSGIWQEINVAAFSPVLRKPNHFQDQKQFFEFWVLSKLLNGNAYILKVRDGRQAVTSLYTLDPNRVRTLVAPNGEVFYQVAREDLSQLPDHAGYVLPAREIIHDRWNCLFHPLVGLSPIYAAGVAAVQGLNIQNDQTNFFGNGARPGGILTAPGAISQENADRLKTYFEDNFTGDNAGKVAVVGDGLEYEPMAMTAIDSELIKQLAWSDEKIASCYHVPLFLVSSASYPPYNSVVSLMTMFYSMCIQDIAEAIELCLDHGLGLTEGEVAAQRYGTEFNRDDLFTMDLAALMETLEKGKNYLTPDEGRRKLNLPPTTGGGVVYRQQQDFSLAALAKRDAKEDPFAKEPKTPKPAAPPAPPSNQPEPTDKVMLRYRVRAAAQKSVEKWAA